MENTNITFKKYVNEIADGKVRKNINSYGIAGYFVAAFNFILALLFSPMSILDVLIIGGLSAGIHIAKNRVCAILLCIFSIANAVISIIQTGKLTGALILFIGIASVKEMNKAYKSYQAYLKENSL